MPSDVPGPGLQQQGTIAVEAELSQTKTSSGNYIEWPDFVLSTSKCKDQRLKVFTSHGNGNVLGHFVITKRYRDTWEEGRIPIWIAEDD